MERECSKCIHNTDKECSPWEWMFEDKDKNRIEHLNNINTLSDQISALLDLMMFTDSSVDIKSIHTASEMCLNMLDELMAEVNKISKELK